MKIDFNYKNFLQIGKWKIFGIHICHDAYWKHSFYVFELLTYKAKNSHELRTLFELYRASEYNNEDGIVRITYNIWLWKKVFHKKIKRRIKND